jgi:release factor glutamine methyltransferase
MRTIHAALQEAEDAIGKVDARVIVAHLLGVDRAYLATHPMHILTETEDARIDFVVAQRQLGQPVAYLVEKREFYGREFLVGPEVLIPRPETEGLVEAALDRIGGEAASVLELGTGSGAIAVTLACERPGLRVTAVEVDAAALEVARRNAMRHEAPGGPGAIEFLAGSWYAPVAGRRFDLIVANPPYVAEADPHLGQGDLRFEPRGALTDGSADGLDSIRTIIAGAAAHLSPGGWLLLEHGYDQAGAVLSLLAAADLASLVTLPDLAGIPRVAGGRLK